MRSVSTSAPSRRRRRASTAPETGSKLVSTLLGDAGGGQCVGIERCGQPDPRRRLQLQRRDRQQRRAGERIGAWQPRPAAAGQPEAARLAAALGDAVGEGGGEQAAGVAIGGRVGPHPSAIARGHPADARQGATVGRGIAIGERGQPQADIRRRVGTAQRVALLQQRGEIGGQRCLGWRPGRQHHRRQAWMRAQSRHTAAGIGDAPRGVERAKLGQQRGRCGQRALRRRVEESQVGGRGAPGSAVEHQPRQLRLEDLRPVVGGQAAM